MALTSRNKSKYYSRSHRHYGKVVRTYIGAGPVAKIIALRDEAARAFQQADVLALKEEKGELAPVLLLSKRLDAEVREVLTVTMLAAGYQRVNRTWRRMPVITKWEKSKAQIPSIAALESDEPQMAPTTDELRRFLRGQPPAAETVGGLAIRTAHAWITLAVNGNEVARETLFRGLEEFITGFGPAKSPVERLLINQSAGAWSEMRCFEIRAVEAASQDRCLPRQHFLQAQLDRSSRRLAFLARQLVVVRSLLDSGSRGE